MDKQQIFDWIAKALAEDFDIEAERIKPESRLYEDLDIDSIDAVDLMVRLKQLTGQRLSPDAFRSVRTIGDVVDAVHDLTQTA
jgi:acyl carrier protein